MLGIWALTFFQKKNFVLYLCLRAVVFVYISYSKTFTYFLILQKAFFTK